MNIFLEYIRYFIQSKGRHGTHSPFVYDFVDQCIRHRPTPEIKNQIKIHRSSVHSDTRVINVVDLGAGSKKLNTKRVVRKIAKTSGSGIKFGKLLYNIAHHYRPKNTLELGTSLGIGTLHLGIGNPEGQVHTVEGCPNTQAIAREHLDKTGIKNIHFYNQSFEDFLKQTDIIYDLVFLDGDHRGNKLIDQLKLLEKITHDETLFILDDIRWTTDMFAAWKHIYTDEKYHLTLDLFRMGIIAKRKHQQKEHFVVRY